MNQEIEKNIFKALLYNSKCFLNKTCWFINMSRDKSLNKNIDINPSNG